MLQDLIAQWDDSQGYTVFSALFGSLGLKVAFTPELTTKKFDNFWLPTKVTNIKVINKII